MIGINTADACKFWMVLAQWWAPHTWQVCMASSCVSNPFGVRCTLQMGPRVGCLLPGRRTVWAMPASTPVCNWYGSVGFDWGNKMVLPFNLDIHYCQKLVMQLWWIPAMVICTLCSSWLDIDQAITMTEELPDCITQTKFLGQHNFWELCLKTNWTERVSLNWAEVLSELRKISCNPTAKGLVPSWHRIISLNLSCQSWTDQHALDVTRADQPTGLRGNKGHSEQLTRFITLIICPVCWWNGSLHLGQAVIYSKQN